jgi:hypothetical protein
MEFLVAAQAENEAPSEAALQRWLDGHRLDYATDPVLSFDQIYVGSDASRVAAALAELKRGGTRRVLLCRCPFPQLSTMRHRGTSTASLATALPRPSAHCHPVAGRGLWRRASASTSSAFAS